MDEPAFDRVFDGAWMRYALVDQKRLHYFLSVDPADIQQLQDRQFRRYRAEAVNQTLKVVGRDPAVLLSGGIDSQLMVYAFVEARLNISPVILDYEGLNEFDVAHAVEFCRQLGVQPTIRKHPVRWVLNRFCLNYGQQYRLRSPQFASHAYACKQLSELGYTGAVFGGNAPYLSNGKWVYGSTAAQLLDLPTFSHRVNWPIVGSFCSWTWRQGLALAALSDEVGDHDQRYRAKVRSYQAYGCPIVPQERKFTGFENVKREVDEAEGTPGYFELKYRVPLYAVTPNQDETTWLLSPEQEAALNDLKLHYDRSR